MIPAGATGRIKRVGLDCGAARTLRLWGFESNITARGAASCWRYVEVWVEMKVGAEICSVSGTVQRGFAATSSRRQTHPREEGRLRVKRA